MKVLIVSLLLVFFGNVLSDASKNNLIQACRMDDLHCLGSSMTSFLERSHKGIPHFGIMPIDPINIPAFEVVFDDSIGITYKYKNLTVTGLKKLELVDFKMDVPANAVVLVTKANVVISGDVLIDYTKKSKIFEGYVTSKATLVFTASYGYKVEIDSKNQTHYVVGDETIDCTAETVPDLQLSPALLQSLSRDEDIKKLSEETRNEMRSKAFCKILAETYKPVIGNLRTVSKVLPVTAFFKSP